MSTPSESDAAENRLVAERLNVSWIRRLQVSARRITPANSSPFVYGSLIALAQELPVLVILVASLFLSDEAFAIVAILVTTVTTASLLSDSGMDAAATFLASRQSNKRDKEEVLAALNFVRVTVAGLTTICLITIQYVSASHLNNRDAQVLVAVLVVTGSLLAARNSAYRVQLRLKDIGEPRALLLEKAWLAIAMLALLLVLPKNATSGCLAFATANCQLPPSCSHVDQPHGNGRPVAK